MKATVRRTSRRAALTLLALAAPSGALRAQSSGSVEGRVLDVATGRAVVAAVVSLESATQRTRTDSTGAYRLLGVAPGPQTLVVRALGFSPARLAVTVPAAGRVVRDVGLARIALNMPQVRVTADGVGRARGELGTATVMHRDAIQLQNAPSLAGVLELLPGIPLRPPGLDGLQQISLRSVPTASGIAERLAAFGTLIVMDGVPMSNNANLQSLGPRGELPLITAAGGSIDLRRIPATMLERVEVIRGVPSSRYGDLTSGAIIIDTRAGPFPAELVSRLDPNTAGTSWVGGRSFGARQEGALTTDLARSKLAPGVLDASVWRGTATLAHRLALGAGAADEATGPSSSDGSLVIDTRLSLYQLYQREPEQPEVRPGRSSGDRSGGLRLSQRARLGHATGARFELTSSLEAEEQHAWRQEYMIRGAEPFTDRLTPGTSEGRFVQGVYIAAVDVRGRPRHLYLRGEGTVPGRRWGGEQTLRVGGELRREWTTGPGYQFAIDAPPQTAFNGVNGYDRPRRFDATPPVATSAAYLDARWVRALGTHLAVTTQGGLRMDALHRGAQWISGARDVVLQPRLNVEVAPAAWLRLRGGAGRTAKQPSIADLAPAPQYFDVVNVNWYPPNAAERLAVLTTSILDPTNTRLGYAVADTRELGLELDLGGGGAALSVAVFDGRTQGAVGFAPTPGFLRRDRFALSDTVPGSGRPPRYSTRPVAADTVPLFVDVPTNLHTVTNRGIEWTLSLPEISAVQTRIDVSGAWIVSRLANDALDVGVYSRVAQFQQDARQARTPYWRGDRQRGERALTTARFVHHQPRLGLVVTGTVQYFLRESTVQEGAIDTLAWSGYVTRTGQLVPVPARERSSPQFADLRQPRQGLVIVPASPPPDWLLSVQVTKAILGTGRLSFYAFNALDRLGRPSTLGREARLFARNRFGLELTLPMRASVWR